MKKNSKLLLSIICPIYNGEKVVGNLIESLENQEYKDYELILINDGSEDNTWDVIQNYAKQYSNIVLINKKNTGVGDTRNEGLKIAKGKYIAFADADDTYTIDFFEKIIPEIKKEDFEMLVFNANVMNHEKYLYAEISEKYSSGSFIEKHGVEKYLQGEFCYRIGNVPWNKIYLSKIIKENNIWFEKDKKTGEDLIFNICYVSKIEKYKYLNIKLYNYMLNMIVNKNRNYFENCLEENLKYYELLEKICKTENIKTQYLSLFFLRRFPGIVQNEVNNKDYYQGKLNIKKYLCNEKMKKVFTNINLRNIDLKLFICYLFYKLKIYNFYYCIKWKIAHKIDRGGGYRLDFNFLNTEINNIQYFFKKTLIPIYFLKE